MDKLWTWCDLKHCFLQFVLILSTARKIKPQEAQFHLVKENDHDHNKSAPEQHFEGTVREI
jgi:hypothetical protein